MTRFGYLTQLGPCSRAVLLTHSQGNSGVCISVEDHYLASGDRSELMVGVCWCTEHEINGPLAEMPALCFCQVRHRGQGNDALPLLARMSIGVPQGKEPTRGVPGKDRGSAVHVAGDLTNCRGDVVIHDLRSAWSPAVLHGEAEQT